MDFFGGNEMQLYTSTEIGLWIGRGRSTVNMIADRLGVVPLRMMGNRRIFNQSQAAAIMQAFAERSVFLKPGRKISNDF